MVVNITCRGFTWLPDCRSGTPVHGIRIGTQFSTLQGNLQVFHPTRMWKKHPKWLNLFDYSPRYVKMMLLLIHCRMPPVVGCLAMASVWGWSQNHDRSILSHLCISIAFFQRPTSVRQLMHPNLNNEHPLSIVCNVYDSQVPGVCDFVFMWFVWHHILHPR